MFLIFLYWMSTLISLFYMFYGHYQEKYNLFTLLSESNIFAHIFCLGHFLFWSFSLACYCYVYYLFYLKWGFGWFTLLTIFNGLISNLYHLIWFPAHLALIDPDFDYIPSGQFLEIWKFNGSIFLICLFFLFVWYFFS